MSTVHALEPLDWPPPEFVLLLEPAPTVLPSSTAWRATASRRKRSSIFPKQLLAFVAGGAVAWVVWLRVVDRAS